MIRVELPAHLRTLAGVGYELALDVAAPVTTRGVLDALEQTYPTLSGTMRDHASGKRRPFVRFFVCGQDWSLKADDAPLPDAIVSGAEPFLIIGAIAGG
jgi:molybdopterin synthase sulfur carrier subunit